MIDTNELNEIADKKYKEIMKVFKLRKRKYFAWYALCTCPMFIYVGCKYGLLGECVAILFFMLNYVVAYITFILVDIYTRQ